MKLTPLHALGRSMMVGAAGGLVLALGVVIWRAISEDAVGGTALAFLAATVVTGGLGIPVMRWSYGRSMRKAEPMPDDSEEIDVVVTALRPLAGGRSAARLRTPTALVGYGGDDLHHEGRVRRPSAYPARASR